MDFLVAALVLLLLLLYHFGKQKKLNNSTTRIFHLFLLIAICDVALEIVCTILMVYEIPAIAVLSKMLLSIFYFMQILFPYFVVYYTQTLRRTSLAVIHKSMKFWAVIPLIMAFLVLVNLWNGMMFSFDRMGIYHRGPYYLLMYAYGILYAFIALGMLAVYRKELVRREILIMIEVMMIEAVCVSVQAVTDTYLMTGFGIALGLIVLYLMVNNPHIYLDSVTNTFNKHYLNIWMREQLDRGKKIHILSIDVENLGRVNKVFGTEIGDKLLIRCAGELQKASEHATLFKISGRRFLLAMENLTDYEICRREAQKIFNGNFHIDGEEVSLHAAICGIVNTELIGNMDVLHAYLDYMSGLSAGSEGTTIIQSDDKIMDGFLYEQEVERFLATAIEQDLFELYFQPVYSLKKGGYDSLEALSRLRHPTLGNIPPDVFITLAEKNGQISKIGQLQFRRLCRFLKEHEVLKGTLQNVKFNISPIELLKEGHGRMLIETVKEFELDPSWIQFEITETAATEYSQTLHKVVNELQQAGLGLCLDDFGSGYANLNTVMKLPFVAIKMDRSLLHDVSSQPQAALLYKSIVEVLQKMGYEVIAEGAETKEEVQLLHHWNVDMIQGYYFSRPVSGTDIVKMLTINEEPPKC